MRSFGLSKTQYFALKMKSQSKTCCQIFTPLNRLVICDYVGSGRRGVCFSLKVNSLKIGEKMPLFWLRSE